MSLFECHFINLFLEHPNAELATLNKEAGKAWRELSEDERKAISSREETRNVKRKEELKKGRDKLCETVSTMHDK